MYGQVTGISYYPEHVTGMNGFIDDLGNFVGGVIGLPKAETPGGINPSDPAASADDGGDNATVNPNAGNDDSAPMDTTTMLLYVAVGGVAIYVLGKYAFDWW